MHAPESMQALPDEAGAYPPPRQAWYAVALLGLAIVIAYLDRQILFLLVEPIKGELHLSDTQFGALQGLALGLFMAVAAVPLGRIADRSSRRRLIAGSVIAWSVMTALTGFAQNFEQLFLCRIGVGVAEAGLAPAAYSMLADLFPARRRVAANLIFYAIAFVGASATMAIGGLALGWIEALQAGSAGMFGGMPPWRLLLVALAIPGPLLALLFFTLAEPVRKGVGNANTASRFAALQYAWTHRGLYGWLFAGLLLVGVADNAIMTWLPTVLVRSFHMSGATAGVQVGTAAAVTSLVSFAIGYLLARKLAPSADARGLLLVMQLGVFVTLPAMLLFLVVDDGSTALLLAAVALFGIWASACLTPTLLQTVAPNELRGQMSAIYAILSVAGAAIHPLAIGMLSDRVFTQPDGLRIALVLVAAPAILLGTISLRMAARFYRRAGTGVAA